jgi:hypothetical protein
MNDKVESLDEKIKKLQYIKQKELAKGKAKERKLLNKQKIIIGGYMLNKIKQMTNEEQTTFKDEILKTIPEKKKTDIEAIKNLKLENENN